MSLYASNFQTISMKDAILAHISKTLNCDITVIKQYRNTPYYLIPDDAVREKILIFNTYYDFIDNDSCLNFINNANDIMKTLKHKPEDLIIIIIILKSFLDRKTVFNEFNVHYVNSDDIFNYASDQYYKYLILNKKFKYEAQVNTLVLYIISLLKDHGLITEKIIIFNDKTYKTFKYYKIESIEYVKPLYSFFNFSYTDFKLLLFDDKYYITTHHYSKTFELSKKNFNSNKSFKIKNLNYIMKKINMKLYIDKEYQTDLKLLIKDDIRYMMIIIKDKVEKINLLFDKTLWTSQSKLELSNTQAEISKLMDKMIVIFFSNYNFENVHVIFPLFMDFRGRKYYLSHISPTTSKLLRLCYYYGYYDKKDFVTTNVKYSAPFIEQIEVMCLKHNFSNDLIFYEIYFWCLIGIGKHLVNKNDCPIKIEKFIELGLMYLNESIDLKLEDKLEVNHYLRIMKSFNYDKIKKRSIIKDATASIYQVFMKKLGPLNQESLNYINLGMKNEWYDTYTVCKIKFYDYIIKKGICLTYHNALLFNEVLLRILIKNPIMTIPYGAGFALCWNVYIKTIKDMNLNIDINSDLKNLFSNFYDFIKKMMQEEYLFIKSSRVLIEKMNEEFENERKYILESETGEADISYYKMKKSSVDKKYTLDGKSKRITKLILVPTSALDIVSFNKASGANTAHFLDADEIRSIELELGYCIITVHDSFLIDMNNCTKLIDIKLHHYQKAINKFNSEYTIKSIFIAI